MGQARDIAWRSVSVPLLLVCRAIVLSKLWLWFMVPCNFEVITPPLAIGILGMVLCIAPQPTATSEQTLTAMISLGVVLAIGWIASWFW